MDLLAAYRVDDLIPESGTVRLVFLLESPHTHEIIHKVPLAGSAGKSVSRFLARRVAIFREWDRRTPFGLHLQRHPVLGMALLNASNYPLDKTAYRPEDYLLHKDLIDAWDYLRRNPATQARTHPRIRELRETMARGLRERTGKLPSDALIIPCGQFARKILTFSAVPASMCYPKCVPHPARNQWDNDRNFEDVEGFLKAIEERIG